jgi:heme oxygenase
MTTLAEDLKDATWGLHQETEHASFLQDLLAGRLPLSDYARMVVQHRAIYGVLEEAVAANRDPLVAPFLLPELTRVPALEADLAFLGDPVRAVLPSTEAFCAHLRSVCFDSSAALLAHHYVRYLGDLSGGQVIGRVLRRVFGFADERGTEALVFPDLASIRDVKVGYREKLDALPWSEPDRATLLLEAGRGYRFAWDVLVELGDPA